MRSIKLTEPKVIVGDGVYCFEIEDEKLGVRVWADSVGQAKEQFIVAITDETGGKARVVGEPSECFLRSISYEGKCSLHIERVFSGDTWKPSRFIMRGPTGEHALSYRNCNAERLRDHWDGFCKNNKTKITKPVKWDKKHYYL